MIAGVDQRKLASEMLNVGVHQAFRPRVVLTPDQRGQTVDGVMQPPESILR